MKDRQLPAESATAHIPVVSPALHCVAITTLVYLRSSFGYLQFRPRSVFFALAWCQVLFAIYAWNEPRVWAKYSAEVIFGIGAIVLYAFHFFRNTTAQVTGRAESDSYSGTSHLLRFVPRKRDSDTLHREVITHLVVEPAAVLCAAFLLRFAAREHPLSTWLTIAAGAMFLKALTAHWQDIRRRKKQGDILRDADETLDPAPPQSRSEEAPKPGARKEKVHRQRAQTAAREEDRFAELLRLMPPYTLEQAEENYRRLAKEVFPDANQGDAESTKRAADLNAAIEFFRLKAKSQ
jgi:hypothetical protein